MLKKLILSKVLAYKAMMIEQAKKIFFIGFFSISLCGASRALGEVDPLSKADKGACRKSMNTPLDVNLEELKKEFLFEKVILNPLNETELRKDLRGGKKRFLYLDRSGGVFQDKEMLKALRARIHTSVRRKLFFVLNTNEREIANNILKELGEDYTPPRVLDYSLVKGGNFPGIIANSLSMTKRTILSIRPEHFIEGLSRIDQDTYEEMAIHTDALYFLDLNDLRNEEDKQMILAFLKKSQAVFLVAKSSQWMSSVLKRVGQRNNRRREKTGAKDRAMFLIPQTHQPYSYREVKTVVQEKGIKDMDEYREAVENGVLPPDFPLKPNSSFRKQWEGVEDFFGTAVEVKKYSFREVRQRVLDEGLQTLVEYQSAVKSGLLPSSFPIYPDSAFPREWKGADDFFGRTFERVLAKVKELGISNLEEYREAKRQGLLPNRFPGRPDLKFPQWLEIW